MESLKQLQAEDDSRTEALRALGGLLLGIGGAANESPGVNDPDRTP